MAPSAAESDGPIGAVEASQTAVVLRSVTVTPSTHDDALDRVRSICMAFPEVTERASHGSPAWFVRDKKTIAMFLDDHHGDGRLAIWCAAEPGVQVSLVASDPEVFFVPAYVGHRGWVGVSLDKGLGWDEVGEILEDAFRHVAPAKLIAQLDDA